MTAAEMVKPVGDRILVKALDTRPAHRGHELLGEQDQVVARVISLGTGSRIGKRIVYPNLKTGEVVVFHEPAGTTVRIGKGDYYVVRGDDVLKVNTKALTFARFIINERAARSIPAETQPKLHTKRAGLLKELAESVPNPRAFLYSPNVHLDGRRPIELLGTDQEDRVVDILDAIRYVGMS